MESTIHAAAKQSCANMQLRFNRTLNCMSPRLIPLSNVKTKGQQQIFKAYGFSIKRVAEGGGGVSIVHHV